MTSSSRRLAAVLLTTALAAGCGQATSATSGPPASTHARINPDLLAAAGAATAHAGSARLTMQMRMSGPQGSYTAQAHGLMTFSKPSRGSLSMLVKVPTAATPLSMSERILGTTLYMRMPFLNQVSPKLKPWLKLDLAAAGKAEGLNLGAVMNSSTNDPASILAYVQGASGDVKDLGPATIGGVKTTHYHATIDYAKVVANLRKTNRAAAATIQKAAEMSGLTTAPIDVWVDGSGLMRQERVTVAAPSTGTSMSILLDLSQFGTPVRVSPPPASQTTDLMKLLKSMPSPGQTA
ncbi:MAG: hypothetical protein ACTHNU_04180 [Gaiellales bacterium]